MLDIHTGKQHKELSLEIKLGQVGHVYVTVCVLSPFTIAPILTGQFKRFLALVVNFFALQAMNLYLLHIL